MEYIMKHYSVLAGLAALLLIFSLAGCKPSGPDASAPDSSAEESTAATTADSSDADSAEPDDSSDSASGNATTAQGGDKTNSTNKPQSNSTTKKPGAKTTVFTTKRTTYSTAAIKYPAAPNANFKYQTSSVDKKNDMKFLVPVSEKFTVAQPKTGAKEKNGVYNALDFGATPNDLSDDSDALNEAFSYAGSNAVLYIPGGLYIINKPLTIPAGVQVAGDFTAPGCTNPTVFLAYYGHGDAGKSPLITIGGSSTFSGIQIYYPKQDKKSPVKYPATIRSTSPDTTIDTVFIVNPWEALNFRPESGRHYIRNFYAQPLNVGISIDNCLDVGRLRNIRFDSYWSEYAADYQRKNATGIYIKRSDWQYVDTVTICNMQNGWHFDSSAANVLLDNCQTVACDKSVLVDDSRNGAGVIFSKCTLDGQFKVVYTNGGNLTLRDCVLTANKYNSSVMRVAGSGALILRSSLIDSSKSSSKKDPALFIDTDQTVISGNTFSGGAAVQIHLDSEVKGATVVGNVVPGGAVKVEKATDGNVVQ